MHASNKHWHSAIATLNAKDNIEKLYTSLEEDAPMRAAIHLKIAQQELAEVGKHLIDVVHRYPRKPIA